MSAGGNGGKTARPKKRHGRACDDDISSSDDYTANDRSKMVTSETPMQCYGHKCRLMARPGSKYCSDNCGINLVSFFTLNLFLPLKRGLVN